MYADRHRCIYMCAQGYLQVKAIVMCELQVTIHTQILPSCLEAHHDYSVVYFSLISGFNKEWWVGLLSKIILRKSLLYSKMQMLLL